MYDLALFVFAGTLTGTYVCNACTPSISTHGKQKKKKEQFSLFAFYAHIQRSPVHLPAHLPATVRVRVRVELVVGLARGEGEGEGEGPSTIYITICIYTAKAKGETKPLPQN